MLHLSWNGNITVEQLRVMIPPLAGRVSRRRAGCWHRNTRVQKRISLSRALLKRARPWYARRIPHQRSRHHPAKGTLKLLESASFCDSEAERHNCRNMVGYKVVDVANGSLHAMNVAWQLGSPPTIATNSLFCMLCTIDSSPTGAVQIQSRGGVCTLDMC